MANKYCKILKNEHCLIKLPSFPHKKKKKNYKLTINKLMIQLAKNITHWVKPQKIAKKTWNNPPNLEIFHCKQHC